MVYDMIYSTDCINASTSTTLFGTRGFYVLDVSVPAPSKVKHEVDIFGRGKVDLSEQLLGYPMYENRQIEITIAKNCAFSNMQAELRNIYSDFHDKTMFFCFTNDRSFSWCGKFAVTGYTEGVDTLYVNLTAECRPYRTNLANGTNGWYEKKIKIYKSQANAESSMESWSIGNPQYIYEFLVTASGSLTNAVVKIDSYETLVKSSKDYKKLSNYFLSAKTHKICAWYDGSNTSGYVASGLTIHYNGAVL